MNADQRPPNQGEERHTRTDRRPVVRFVGLEISMFWTAAIIFIIAIVVILYLVLR